MCLPSLLLAPHPTRLHSDITINSIWPNTCLVVMSECSQSSELGFLARVCSWLVYSLSKLWLLQHLDSAISVCWEAPSPAAAWAQRWQQRKEIIFILLAGREEAKEIPAFMHQPRFIIYGRLNWICCTSQFVKDVWIELKQNGRNSLLDSWLMPLTELEPYPVFWEAEIISAAWTPFLST